jgi:hypothetical protein
MHPAAVGRPATLFQRQRSGQPDRAVHRMAVCAERTAFRTACLPDGV